MDSLISLYTELYSLNSFSTSHSPKREINSQSVLYTRLYPQLLFWCVEILLRMYVVYYQYSYTHIHQFNKKIMELQGFKLLPCDGVITSNPPYRLIPTFPVVVQLVGGICQPVLCRCKFPALLQHLSYLVLFRLDLRVYQQHKNIIRAERKCVRADTLHDVKD